MGDYICVNTYIYVCICAHIHAYIHASCILDLLCWILFVFFHWMFDCSVSVAIFSSIGFQKPCCCGHPASSHPAAMPRWFASKTKSAMLEQHSAPARGAGARKRPASAESVKSKKKRTATGAVLKRPGAEDCTAVSTRKDRNKWGFLWRNRDSLDARVLQMLSGANQREKAVLVNNVVRRNNEGDWEFDINNPVLNKR